MKRIGSALAFLAALGLSGCVTVAEFRKLEREVLSLKREPRFDQEGGRERLAELGAQVDALEAELASLSGRFEVIEHQAEQALEEAKAARREAAASGQVAAGEGGEPPVAEGTSAEEVAAYRDAYAAWRNGDGTVCIDRFRSFLQTYPTSPQADDAAYWLADCHFKQGDYKTAILRFDDVVARYPGGGKAADALYRQGEALLKLGPGYAKAAGKAFERVVREYPDSPRAVEAKRQLELLGSG